MYIYTYIIYNYNYIYIYIYIYISSNEITSSRSPKLSSLPVGQRHGVGSGALVSGAEVRVQTQGAEALKTDVSWAT